MDLSTCTIAGGKVQVARAKGEQVPANCIVNNRGEPSTDPNDFLGEPPGGPGALLTIAGHKGFALSMFAEIFAGAISGGRTSQADIEGKDNDWFALFIDPAAFCGKDHFDQQIGKLADWVKSSKTMPGVDEVLLPGEPEQRALAQRRQQGISIEDNTWQALSQCAAERGVSVPDSK